MRYTFEVLAMGLLIAAGSVLRPLPSAAPCKASVSAPAHATRAANPMRPEGGRG